METEVSPLQKRCAALPPFRYASAFRESETLTGEGDCRRLAANEAILVPGLKSYDNRAQTRLS
jgi:hypothetical protein